MVKSPPASVSAVAPPAPLSMNRDEASGERGQRETEDQARECDEFAHGTAPNACPATAPRRRGQTLAPARAAPGRRPEMAQARRRSMRARMRRDPARVPRRRRRGELLGLAARRARARRRRRRTAFVASRPRPPPRSSRPRPPPRRGFFPIMAPRPGRLLRLRKGEELKLRLVNRLDEGTTLSFPGLRAANAAAGIGGLTQPLVAPGAELDIRFTPPDSGFNLYCPDAGGATARQIGSGLFGPIVVEEARPPAADLEAVVVLADWRLDEKGQIEDDFSDASVARAAGRLGALVTASAAPAPLTLTAAPGARVRLRLANAATARVMSIGVDRRQTADRRGRRPAERAVRAAAQRLSHGARRALRADVRHAARGRRGGRASSCAAAKRRAIPGEVDRPMVVFEAQRRGARGALRHRRPARQPAAAAQKSISSARKRVDSDDRGRRRRALQRSTARAFPIGAPSRCSPSRAARR